MLSAATEPFLLVVVAAEGEVGPLVRGLSDDLEDAPVEDDDAELVTETPADCFAV